MKERKHFFPSRTQTCVNQSVVELACVAGVRKGRGRELGRETPFPF